MSQHPFQNFTIRFRAGERIFDEGDPGSTMFIVQQGRVELSRTVGGQKQTVGVMEKGDFFGEMSILEGLPRTLCADAAEDVELIEINSMIFDKMIRGNIEIAIRMLRKLSIRLRETEIKLSDLLASGTRPASQARVSPVAAGQPSRAARTGVRLEVPEGEASYPLGEEETIIGRYDPVTEQRPDIDLTDLDVKRSVSRRHARILRAADTFVVVEEVGALNGTFVNGSQIVTGQRHPIVDGDRLTVGTVSMVFRT
jgi:CRP-like cAMP-binding protein